MMQMMDTVSDHSKYDAKECFWPKYHTDKQNLLNGKFGNLQVLSYEGEPADKILRSFFKSKATNHSS